MISHSLCSATIRRGSKGRRMFCALLALLSSLGQCSFSNGVATSSVTGSDLLDPTFSSDSLLSSQIDEEDKKENKTPRNLMEIFGSDTGEYTFHYQGGTDAPTIPGQPLIESAQEAMPGPGCIFSNSDGTETTFVEGQSMGTYKMEDTCANNVPEAFPCYCISGAPGQTVCPYCIYRNVFNQNICGGSGESIPVALPNMTIVTCQCTVSVIPVGGTYTVRASSNCDAISSTNAVPATATTTIIDTATLPPATTSPSMALPMTPTPASIESISIPPTTALPFISPWTTVPPTTDLPATTNVPVSPVPPPGVSMPPVTYQPGNPSVTYQPGNLTVMSEGLWMSQGLSVRTLAQAGFPLTYEAAGGGPSLGGTTTAVFRQNSLLSQSQEVFHPKPDGAAVFLDNRPSNPQGWIWVSNSEETDGGVGAVTFNAQGQVIDYRRILTGTLWNCNGGPTPWGTWVSAEEDMDRLQGVLWQVDPYGVRQPEVLTLGIEGGAFEAFAFDIRNLNQPYFFATEDDEEGTLRRWTPYTVEWEADPWSMLHGPGLTEFLVLQPNFEWGDGNSGTFIWVTDEVQGRASAKDYYQHSEGIDVHGSTLTFVCKSDFVMFQLNLDTYVYQRSSTQSGLFDGEPDQVRTIIQDDGSALLYFTEDQGNIAGIHALDEAGNFRTILEGPGYEPGAHSGLELF
jgi:uncharacterized protein